MNGELWSLLTGFNEISAVFRILLAALIGGCIGFERGQHGHAAGLRTHILVCVGATVTVLTGFYTGINLGFSNDPLRLSAQVISGIGFLGAGTIMMRNEARVTGLTTAAGLWAAACIGLAVGAGFYVAALAAFFVVILSITVLAHLESEPKNRNRQVYYIELEDVALVNVFCDMVEGRVRNLQIISPKSGISHHVGIIFVSNEPVGKTEVLELARQVKGVVIAVPT